MSAATVLSDVPRAANDNPATVLVLGHAPPPPGVESEAGVQRVGDAYDALAALAAVPRHMPVTLIISLAGLPGRHATVVRAAKRLRPDADVLLADCDGRPAMFGQLVVHGADALIAADGVVHRFSGPVTTMRPQHEAVRDVPSGTSARATPEPFPRDAGLHDASEPLLSPAELAALLADDDPFPLVDPPGAA